MAFLNILDLLLDSDQGTLRKRQPAFVLDSSTTSLPSPASSISADGMALVVDQRVLFTHLSDASKNNRIYKVATLAVPSGTHLELVLETDGGHADGSPSMVDIVHVKEGTHATQLWAWDGSEWTRVDFTNLAPSTVSEAPIMGDLDMGSHKVKNMEDPSSPQDAATKHYVDSITPPATSPGGTDTQVQFNDSNTFGGSAGLTFDKNTNGLAVGSGCSASGGNAFAQGQGCNAGGPNSHAEGLSTSAGGLNACHAEGFDTSAGSIASHAEGEGSQALGRADHSEGASCTAHGSNSLSGNTAAHAEGVQTQATNAGAHSEGISTQASGSGSHAEGNSTIASGNNSHASGQGTVAQADNQTVVGQYNTPVGTSGTPALTDEIFSVGNGTDGSHTATAFAILRAGDMQVAGSSGTSGQVLKSNGPGALPSWTSAPSAPAPNSVIKINSPTGFGSSGTRARIYSNVAVNNGGSDLSYTSDAVNGDSITVNTTGLYSISFSDGETTTSDPYMGVIKNSTNTERGQDFSTYPSKIIFSSGTSQTIIGYANTITYDAYLMAGDVLTFQDDLTIGGHACNFTNAFAFLSVTRLS